MSALTDSTNIHTETEVTNDKPIVDSAEPATTVETTEAVEAPTSEETPAEKTAEVTSEVTAEAAVETETATEAVAEVKTEAVVEAEESAKDATPVEEKTTEEETETVTVEVQETVSVITEEVEKQEGEEAMETEEPAEVEMTKEEKQKKHSERVIEGRRHMMLCAFDKATEALSEAATLCAEIFGEKHPDTFDTIFLYGQALLELAKMEDGVLNNALTDCPKATEGEEEKELDGNVEGTKNIPEEEREEISKEVNKALGVADETIEEETSEEKKEEEATDAAVESEKTEEEASTEEEKAEDVEMTDADVEAEAEAEGETEEQEQVGEEQEEEEDDDSIKLSWEALELARLIAEDQIKQLEAMAEKDMEAIADWTLKQADVLSSLGEHGIIDNKYEQAQKDLMSAMELQKTHLPATSRFLANTNHLLGKAFAADNLFEKAATFFSDAKNILISKVEELKKQLESASEAEKKDIEAEITDLEGVIPDLDGLVVDAAASAEQCEKIKVAAKKELEEAAVAIMKVTGEETNDISSLVRRPTKRPADEAEATEEVKKRKSEDGAATVPEQTTSEETETAPAPVTTEE